MTADPNTYRTRLENALNEALWTPPPPSDQSVIASLTRQGLLIRAEAFADALKWLEEEEAGVSDQPLGR